jgi:hypothetical protein
MSFASLMRAVALLVILWLILVLCVGCQARETNLALQQADQATEASQRVMAEKIAPHVAALPPDVQQSVKDAMDQVCGLLTSARTSLRPALTLTAGNEPPPQTDTTVEEAIEKPQQFTAKAAMQVGRATVEVERIGWWLQVSAVALKFGEAAGNNLLALILGGSGGTGLLVAGVLRHVGRLKTAVSDAVKFGNDAVAVAPDDADARRQLIVKHKAIQEANGTKRLIKQAGAAVQLPPIPAQEHS